MEKHTRVLLVDDDKMILAVKGKQLSRRGYEVTICESAVNIITTVANCTPDIIIMDHNMPVVTGMEAIKLLKANEVTYSIPVIYHSSVSDLPAMAKEAGSDAYIAKSGNIDQLTSMITSLTTQRAANT